jgi:hypothetical protein
MRRTNTAAARAASILALLLLSGSAALRAQDAGLYSVSGSLDWSSYTLKATISLDVGKAGLRLPSGRSQAASMIRDEAPRLLRDKLLSLQVDSRRSLSETIASGDVSLEDITDLLESPQAVTSSFSEDFRYFTSDYSVSLLGILSLLVKHSRASGQSAVLDYRPTKDYSGIVIYVSGELPVHGEFTSDAFSPSIFPRIWDERMNLLLERNMVDPAAARAGGIVAYRQKDDPRLMEDRVGGDPLRILAVGLFGTSRCDLIIAREDALLIQTSEKNRALLAAGKVIIVVDKASETF